MNKDLTIQQIQKFTRLSTKEVQHFLSLGIEKTIKKKTLLTQPNLIVDKVYYLKEGCIRHFVIKQNKEFTKNFIRGPRFMLPSLTDFFLQTPSSIYCGALSELKVVEWNRTQIFAFADAHPKMYHFFLRSITMAFKGKELKEIALNQLDSKARYLKFLEDYPNLVNEIPIQYIASFLNIRPETLSRIRANLNS